MRADGCTRKTVETRVTQVKAMCRATGLNDPREVTTGHIVDWLSGCESQWTRCTYAASARAWCRWMVDQGIREDDPSERAPHPKQPLGSPRPVSWKVIERVLADPPSLRTMAYMTLAAYAGLRCGEIAQVRGDDIDLERGWFYVDGKGGQRAAIPLHPAIRRLSRGMSREEFWFPGADHGHVRPKAVSKTLNDALRRAGSSATAHAVRHAYATRLLSECHDTRVVQLLLRHRSLSSTQIYTGVDNGALVAAIDRLPWAG